MAKSKKTVAKKGKPKKKEKVVLAVMAEERPFRLDMEVATHNQTDGTTSYSLVPRMWGGEDKLKEAAEGFKKIGVGGRLVHQDGTPDGTIIEEWFGVDRLAEAKAKEAVN